MIAIFYKGAERCIFVYFSRWLKFLYRKHYGWIKRKLSKFVRGGGTTKKVFTKFHGPHNAGISKVNPTGHPHPIHILRSNDFRMDILMAP